MSFGYFVSHISIIQLRNNQMSCLSPVYMFPDETNVPHLIVAKLIYGIYFLFHSECVITSEAKFLTDTESFISQFSSLGVCLYR